MAAVAAAAAGDARRARQARAAVLTGAIAGTAAALYFGAGWAATLVSAAFIGLLNLLVAAVVRTAEAFRAAPVSGACCPASAGPRRPWPRIRT